MRRVALLTLSLSLALGVAVAAENWPQWRGANGQGISTETQLPTEWGPDKNIAWKTALPHGYSSPIGKELWRTKGVASNAIHAPLVGKDMVIVTAGYPAKRTLAIRTGDVPDDKRIV